MKNISIALSLSLLFIYNNIHALSLEWGYRTGSSSRDAGRSITYDKSGNTIITGYFSGTVDFNPGASVSYLTASGDKDIFIQKLRPNGTFMWAKKMGGAFDDGGNQIRTDKDKNIYTVGHFESSVDFDPNSGVQQLNSAGFYDVFIQKLDSLGNLVWAKRVGSSDYEDALSMNIDNQGNVLITGYFRGTVDFNPGTGVANLTSSGMGDIFILKLDVNGNFVWAKKMGNIGEDAGFSICSDKLNNIYLTGNFEKVVDFNPGTAIFNLSAAGDLDAFILKLDLNGNFIWAKKVGGTGYDSGNSIGLDKDNNIYVSGGFNNSVDFNPNAGVTTLVSNGMADIFVLKLDVTGAFVWAKKMGGIQNDFSTSIAIDNSNNVYFTGYFEKTVDFHPGAQTYLLTAGGKIDAFFEKLDANGNYLYAYRIGDLENEISSSIAVDPNENIYLTGHFDGRMDVDPFAPALNISTAGSLDIFSLKISSLNDPLLLAPTNTSEKNLIENKLEESHEVVVYPNPFQSTLSIESKNDDFINTSIVNIYNVNGQLIEKNNGSNSSVFLLETSTWKDGIYIIEILSNEKIIRKRVVKN